MQLIDINQLLLKTLHDIDTEAMPLEDDYPTGLWYYTGHLDRDKEASRKKLNCEVEWTHRMVQLIPNNKSNLKAAE